MFTKYFIRNMIQKTDREANQDKKSAREELGAWKVEINWNNCLLQRRICYRYHGYSQQNHFTGNTIASLNQSLQFRLMWNHDILDLWRIFFSACEEALAKFTVRWSKYEGLVSGGYNMLMLKSFALRNFWMSP